MCVYIYIYIYIGSAPKRHLSHTTCLTHVFFKRGEYCEARSDSVRFGSAPPVRFGFLFLPDNFNPQHFKSRVSNPISDHRNTYNHVIGYNHIIHIIISSYPYVE